MCVHVCVNVHEYVHVGVCTLFGHIHTWVYTVWSCTWTCVGVQTVWSCMYVGVYTVWSCIMWICTLCGYVYVHVGVCIQCGHVCVCVYTLCGHVRGHV